MKMDFKILEDKATIIFTRERDGESRNVTIPLSEFEAVVKKYAGLSLNDYQNQAKSTCEGNSYSWTYLTAEISEEKGEFDGKIAKMVRKDELPINFTRDEILAMPEEKRDALKKELGDIFWGIAVMADWFGWTLEDVGITNLEKLADRKKRNVIIGNGDER